MAVQIYQNERYDNIIKVVVNAIAFDAVWLGLVYYQNAFVPFALLFLALHCILFLKGKPELILIAKLVIIGTLIDTGLLLLGVFRFEQDSLIIPFWLLILWACFGTTIMHSLAFLSKHLALGIVLGAIAPPMCYMLAAKLGAVDFPLGAAATFLYLSLIWTVFLTYVALMARQASRQAV